MKNTILSLGMMLLAINITSQTPHVCKYGDHHLEEMLKMEESRYRTLQRFSPNALTSDYDIRYHRLEWSVDPAIKYISGEITTFFSPLSDDFQTIHFDLGDSMQVDQVLYRGAEVNFDQIGNNTLAIDFGVTLARDVLDSITVKYQGIPSTSGFSSFNADTHNGGDPVIWTLSEPYGAKDWWPCKQSLSDKIDSIDIFIEMPKAYKAASNGILNDIIINDSTHSYHWKHKYKIPAYLIAIGVTNYDVFSDFVEMPNGDSLEILNYIYPERRIQAELDLAFTVDLITLFNDLFDPYPFANEKYGHAQFGFGGGMEHQTMSFMGGFSLDLQAHELAHQWFGDKITCGSWKDIWLNEGFATYLTGLSREFLNKRTWLDWKARTLSRVVSAPGGSVYVKDTTGIGSIFSGRLSYAKGAMVLHMLRWVLGDDAFFKACRNYLKDPNLAYGYAKTPDLIRVFETTTGLELDEYFDNWIYNEGYPSYTLKWNQKINDLNIKLDQITSHSSVDFFKLPVPIKVYSGNMDTTFRLENTFNGQLWKIDLDWNIDSIKIDPDIWLISKDNSVIKDMTSAIGSPLNTIAQLSPNPANDICQITFNQLHGKYEIGIYNAQGKTVYHSNSNASVLDIQTANWESGSYFISIQLAGKSYFEKLVKL